MNMVMLLQLRFILGKSQAEMSCWRICIRFCMAAKARYRYQTDTVQLLLSKVTAQWDQDSFNSMHERLLGVQLHAKHLS